MIGSKTQSPFSYYLLDNWSQNHSIGGEEIVLLQVDNEENNTNEMVESMEDKMTGRGLKRTKSGNVVASNIQKIITVHNNKFAINNNENIYDGNNDINNTKKTVLTKGGKYTNLINSPKAVHVCPTCNKVKRIFQLHLFFFKFILIHRIFYCN